MALVENFVSEVFAEAKPGWKFLTRTVMRSREVLPGPAWYWQYRWKLGIPGHLDVGTSGIWIMAW
jgi:hypothetical protein